MPKFYKVHEVATILSVNVATVRRRLKDEQLPFIRSKGTSGLVLIPQTTLDILTGAVNREDEAVVEVK